MEITNFSETVISAHHNTVLSLKSKDVNLNKPTWKPEDFDEHDKCSCSGTYHNIVHVQMVSHQMGCGSL